VRNPAFWNAVKLSVAYSFGSTLLTVFIGLSLAFVTTLKVRGMRVVQALYIFPLAVSPILVGVLWSPSSIWDDVFTFTHFILGFPYVNELSPYFFFPVMILSESWEWAPLIMLVSLSVMNSTAKEIYEASTIHGASTWQVFRMIALPSVLRSPVTQFVIVLRLIDSLRAFEVPLA